MPEFYIDTSSLVKRYWRELGTDFVQALFVYVTNYNQKLITLNQTTTELASAASRLAREGKFTANLARSYVQDFLVESTSTINFIEISDEITDRSIDLVFQHPLKAADALHLACALELQEEVQDLIFISDDNRLCTAAESESLTILKPAKDNSIPFIKSLSDN